MYDQSHLPLAFLESIGGFEMIMVGAMAFLLFGGKKMPSFARTVGKTIREFRKASSEVQREIQKAIDDADDEGNLRRPVPTAVPQSVSPVQTPLPYPYAEAAPQAPAPSSAAAVTASATVSEPGTSLSGQGDTTPGAAPSQSTTEATVIPFPVQSPVQPAPSVPEARQS